MQIWGLILNVVSILAFFFDPNTKRRKERSLIWLDFALKQKEFRDAVAAGDPVKTSVLTKEMEAMRERFRFLYIAD